MRRFSIACRHCDGQGFHHGTDDEGNATLDACTCYRGRITLLLNPEDEANLLRQLQSAGRS
jgi:hypothetical protein